MSGLHILRIEAERIKRLKAVSLVLNGQNLVVVGKPNAGKTTVLDLLWMAFLGKAIGPETISAGSDEALIKVVLGNPERQFTVTRKLTRDGEKAGKLKVVANDGAKYGADFLTSLISDLTFDPTEFARAEGKKQVDLLLKVVKLPGGVSIDGLDKERATLYEKRTTVNRDLDRLRAKLPATEPDPATEVSLADLLKEIDQEQIAAEQHNRFNAEKREKLRIQKEELEKWKKTAQGLREQIVELQAKLEKADEAVRAYAESIDIGQKVIDSLVDKDLSPILAKRSSAIQEAEAQNKRARARREFEQAKAEADKVAGEAQTLTEQIQAVDLRKKSVLESVEWPMPGLGVRDGHVTYNDVILDQCGMSVRMRVSCAIAMALNPKLKAIRIDEGESLGEEGRRELFDWAAERGYQVLMSVVKDGPAGEGELEIIDDMISNEPAVQPEAPALAEVAG